MKNISNNNDSSHKFAKREKCVQSDTRCDQASQESNCELNPPKTIFFVSLNSAEQEFLGETNSQPFAIAKAFSTDKTALCQTTFQLVHEESMSPTLLVASKVECANIEGLSQSQSWYLYLHSRVKILSKER